MYIRSGKYLNEYYGITIIVEGFSIKCRYLSILPTGLTTMRTLRRRRKESGVHTDISQSQYVVISLTEFALQTSLLNILQVPTGLGRQHEFA